MGQTHLPESCLRSYSHPVDTSGDSDCIHQLVVWNSLLVVIRSWSTFVFLLATITCVNMAAWTSRDMQVLSCRASNLYGQSWNETIMMVFRIVQALPESYTCTMTVTLAMAANWKKSVHSSTIKVCFGICLGQCTTAITTVTMYSEFSYTFTKSSSILGTLFLLCVMLENL